MTHETLENFLPGWGKELSLRYNTNFFSSAEQIWKIPDLPEKVISKPFEFSYQVLDITRSDTSTGYKNRKQEDGTIKASAIELSINLENFPIDIPPPRVFCIDTEESYAMLAGRWKLPKKGPIHFCPPRLDLGVPAQHDIRELTTQIVQLPQFLEIIKDFGGIDSRAFITDLVRDPRIELQDALYLLSGVTVPRTQFDVHHIKDDSSDNPFKRHPATTNHLNLEGISYPDCEMLKFCDPFASGMQIYKSLEEHLLKIDKNCNSNKIKHLILVSPLATLEGTAINAIGAARHNIQTTVFTSAALLHATKPLMYWCPPYMACDNLIVDPKILKVIEAIYGDKADQIDPWCNWSARRLSPPQALIDSEALELLDHGLTNQIVLDNALAITPQRMAQEIGLNPRSFVSFATVEEALLHDRLRELQEFIDV